MSFLRDSWRCSTCRSYIFFFILSPLSFLCERRSENWWWSNQGRGKSSSDYTRRGQRFWNPNVWARQLDTLNDRGSGREVWSESSCLLASRLVVEAGSAHSRVPYLFCSTARQTTRPVAANEAAPSSGRRCGSRCVVLLERARGVSFCFMSKPSRKQPDEKAQKGQQL